MIYSKYSINYSKGFDLVDYITNKIYNEEEAKKLDSKTKSRLILQPRKIGTWVLTIDECNRIMKEKKNDKRNNGN